ncbi:phosphotransferase [Rickettsia argasii]|uniref:Phosphotransferase enzyme family protein n=1 Tax=Rickettsia argasii T170-B TaxID=1268837 RepID=A0A0F3RDT1_9RICK|nr:phosphotransferase [Rickettsia argasii]KJW04267.1 phosphotransferase enzyme family protein [Rickettsia argasii T170-B]
MPRYIKFVLLQFLCIISLEAHSVECCGGTRSLLDFKLRKFVEEHYNFNIKEISKFDYGLENEVYKIEDTDGKIYVLRISYKKRSKVEQEIFLLQRLCNERLFVNFVPCVIADSENKYIHILGSQIVVLFEYIEGIQKECLDDTEVKYVVSNLAKLHEYSIKFIDYFDKRDIETSEEMKTFLQKLLEKKLINQNFFNFLCNSVDNFHLSLKKYKFLSVVHRDVHWKNLIFTQDNKIVLIDFDDFCISSPILELAVLFRTMCLRNGNIDVERFIKILKEYNFYKLTGEFINTEDLLNMVIYDLLRVAKSKFENVENKKKFKNIINQDFDYIKLIDIHRKELLYLLKVH